MATLFYASHKDVILIMEKIPDKTIVNEPIDYLSKMFITYDVKNIKIIDIINKFYPEVHYSITVDDTYYYGYKIGDIIDIHCSTNLQLEQMRYEDGNIIQFANYKFTGPIITYYDNGKIKSKGNFMHGNMEGIWLYYHKDTGEIEKESTYIKGVKLHIEKCFYPNKEKLSEESFIYKRIIPSEECGEIYMCMQSKYVSWYQQSNDHEQIKYEEGNYTYGNSSNYKNKFGTWYKYDEITGKIKEEINYNLFGILDGIQITYDPSTGTKKINVYENGKLVNKEKTDVINKKHK